MKKIIGIVIVILLLSTAAYKYYHRKPKEAEVLKAVYNYAISSQKCDEAPVLSELKIKSIDAYSRSFGGWKVTYGYVLQCKSAGIFMTYNQADHPVDVFVRKAADGQYEAFIPQIFQRGMDEFSKRMQQDLDNTK